MTSLTELDKAKCEFGLILKVSGVKCNIEVIQFIVLQLLHYLESLRFQNQTTHVVDLEISVKKRLQKMQTESQMV